MDKLQQHLFNLDSKYAKNRNYVRNMNLRVFYGWAKINKIRKKEAISVIFENDVMREEKTLKTIGNILNHLKNIHLNIL